MSRSAPVWPEELAAHRRFLLGLARLQLGHGGEADDVVQDTLLAAAEGAGGFSGGVPLRAWLTGILRHKIVDVLRLRGRMQPLVVVDADGDEDSGIAERGFDAAGRWDTATFEHTQCPQSHASQRQLLEMLELCLHALPPRSAQLVLMREYLGMSTDEIVVQAAVTPGHLRVLLHRARLRLRECVVRGWGEEL